MSSRVPWLGKGRAPDIINRIHTKLIYAIQEKETKGIVQSIHHGPLTAELMAQITAEIH
jgi:hypothetical protein